MVVLRQTFIVWFALSILVFIVVIAGTQIESHTLAFDSNRTGNYDIYVLDLRSRILVNITRDPAQDRNPAWSPDGRYLVFESIRRVNGRSGGNAIYVLDLFNKKIVQRTIPLSVRATQPDWSPNGNYIAFSGATNTMFNNDIFIINLYNGQMSRLTHTPDEYEYGPMWSPDGKMLLYGVYDTTFISPSDIYVMPFVEMGLRLAGDVVHEVRKLSERAGASYPSWTPDSEVMFIYERGSQGIYTTPLDVGENDRLLNDLVFYMEDPVMSPDGELIVFSSAPMRSTLWRQLYVSTVDGSRVWQVTSGADTGFFRDESPAWRPR